MTAAADMDAAMPDPGAAHPASVAGAGTLAVVLLGRGAVYGACEGELTELAARVQAALGAQGLTPLRVQPAFVDRLQPALPQALDACAEAGTIVIIPVMLPDEPALRRWQHKVIMRWKTSRSEQGNVPRLVFAEPLLQSAQLPQLLAETVQQSMGAADVPAVVGDERWENDPVAWSSVPEHQHHVLWCVGPRCAAKGAVQLWPRLAKVVQDTPALKKSVRLLQTSCQYPCNHGPLMITYPDGVWYGPLAEADLGRVLTQHVQHRQVDATLRIHGPQTLPDA